MSSELAKITSDVKFENDLDQPFIGAVIKDPTSLGFIYLFGALGLCFVPGLGVVSAVGTIVMGWFDVTATLAKDSSKDERSVEPIKDDELEDFGHRLVQAEIKALPASENTEWKLPVIVSPETLGLDKSVEYTQPNPWGNNPLPRTPQTTDNQVEDVVKWARGTGRVPKREGFEDESTTELTKTPDLARLMATPDADGYYRSILTTAKTRTGKGLVTTAAATILKTDLGADVELFSLDAKNDPEESHRWSMIPTHNRYQFSGIAPDLNPAEVKKYVDRITKAFYYSKAKYKFLLISELKILMAVLNRASKTAQAEFSTLLSNQACGGASSHRYIWVETNVVGLGENGFNGAGDRDAFELSYIVTERNQEQVTGHKSFIGNPNVPKSAFTESGRAFCSTLCSGWHPVPPRYKEIDETLKRAVPPTISIPEPSIKITDREAEDMALVCNSVLADVGAIALTIEQLAEKHTGISQMLHSEQYEPVLRAALEKAEGKGLIRLIKMGDSLSVGQLSRNKNRA